MMTFVFISTGIYLLLIISFIYGFEKIREFKTQKKSSITSFSILIPFRNEESNLLELVNSIKTLTYDENKFECIFINDESSDSSVEIINDHLSKTELNYSIINNLRKSNSPKKGAINTAINIAQFDWIITTDADCILPKDWLQQFDEFSNTQNCKMIVGPVMYLSTNDSFLENFQILDFLSLQGATLGGFGIDKPFLCNGANLAYQKGAFLELNGFQGNDEIASGDDIFLFEKFYKMDPTGVHFLKSKAAIVTTSALKTWSELIQQRMRWAAKTSSYNLWFGKVVGGIVLLTNITFAISLIGILSDREDSMYYFFCLVLKVLIDFALIKQTSSFYRGTSKKVRGFGFGSILYPFFSIYVILMSATSKYTWKGRRFKK